MIDWLKNLNKEFPQFWKEYSASFEKKSNRYIALSLETTGLNSTQDVILVISAVAIVNDKIIINDSFEIAIPHYKFLHDNNLSNDFIIENSMPKQSEPEAIKQFIEFLQNAVLVGHRINFDIDILNEALQKIECGKLKNEAIDIEVLYKKNHDINDKDFSLNELIKINKLPTSDRISVSDDVYMIALLFLKLNKSLELN